MRGPRKPPAHALDPAPATTASGAEVRRGPYDLCAFCPDLCLDRCPVAEATGSSALSPHAKMLSGWLWTRGVVAPGPDLARLAFQCTGCQACHEACEHGVDVADALFRLRAEWTAAGHSPYDRTLFLAGGVEAREDLIRAQARLVPRRAFVPEAHAVLFAGCRALLDHPQAVRDVLAVFRGLDIEFVGAAEAAAVCCGYPLHAGGLGDDFARHARRVSDSLRRYRLVVALSPCCAHTMRNLFPAAGVESLRVTTALELVAPLVMRVKREPLGQTVAYHDSCFLGRLLGHYSLPREVLGHVLGRPPLELRRAREESPCCGAGGAWDRVAPAEAAVAARRVMALAADAGSDALVTASPACLAHLASAHGAGGKARQSHAVEVMDVFHLLARWLGSRPGRAGGPGETPARGPGAWGRPRDRGGETS